MSLPSLLTHLVDLESHYASALGEIAARTADEHDVHYQCLAFARASERRAAPIARYAIPPDRGQGWLTAQMEPGPTLLEKLRSGYLLAHEVAVTWTMVDQAAKAARNAHLEALARDGNAAADAEARWFLTRIKTGSPQALVVA